MLLRAGPSFRSVASLIKQSIPTVRACFSTAAAFFHVTPELELEIGSKCHSAIGNAFLQSRLSETLSNSILRMVSAGPYSLRRKIPITVHHHISGCMLSNIHRKHIKHRYCRFLQVSTKELVSCLGTARFRTSNPYQQQPRGVFCPYAALLCLSEGSILKRKIPSIQV